MILKGSQRAGAGALASHLMNDRDNDHVTVLEIRGFPVAKRVPFWQPRYALFLAVPAPQKTVDNQCAGDNQVELWQRYQKESFLSACAPSARL